MLLLMQWHGRPMSNSIGPVPPMFDSVAPSYLYVGEVQGLRIIINVNNHVWLHFCCAVFDSFEEKLKLQVIPQGTTESKVKNEIVVLLNL